MENARIIQSYIWASITSRIFYYFSEMESWKVPLFYGFLILKNLPASRAHSHRALRAQLASLSARRARDSIVALHAPEFLNVALCAPFFPDLALRARSCALRIHLSLFLISWYWSSNQFYNNITDDVNYTFSQSHSISFCI